MARLIGRTGVVVGQDFILSDNMRLGASGENEIRIAGEGVSRRHARLVREGDRYWLEDIGATNGTFVNGLRVQRETLHHLDVVTLGRTVDLIFLSREDDPPALPEVDQLIEVKLEFVDGPEAGTIVDIPRGESTLGRAPSCNVAINSPAVGRAHARIARSARRLLIQDLQSANGTFVNGKRIDGAAGLVNGDVIGLAGVRSMAVRIQGTPSERPGVVDLPVGEPRAANQEWRTRFMWGPEELAQIDAARAEAIANAMFLAPDSSVKRPPQAAKPAAAPKPAAPVAARAEPAAAPPPKAAAPPPKTAAPPPKTEAPPPARKAVAPAPPPPVAPIRTSQSGTESITVAPNLSVMPPVARLQGIRLIGPSGPIRLGLGTFKVGRAVDAAVRLEDRQVSRAHAMIVVDEQTAAIEDLKTVNGTMVNGREIKGREPLKSGDTVRLGDSEISVELITSQEEKGR